MKKNTIWVVVCMSTNVAVWICSFTMDVKSVLSFNLCIPIGNSLASFDAKAYLMFKWFLNVCYSICFLLLNLDVDECLAGTHTCDLHATCSNTEGSYICVCNDGYEGNGEKCTGNL